MKRMEKAAFIVLTAALCIACLAAYLYWTASAKADKLAWCWDKYTKVDSAIVRCFNSGNQTLQACMAPWNDKSYLIAYAGCPAPSLGGVP